MCLKPLVKAKQRKTSQDQPGLQQTWTRAGSVKSSIPNFKICFSKPILTGGRVREKREKENRIKVVNYICLLFRFATQTFHGRSRRGQGEVRSPYPTLCWGTNFYGPPTLKGERGAFLLQPVLILESGAPNCNFRENICSEDDLRSRIVETFVVKFLACLPLLGFSNIYKMV